MTDAEWRQLPLIERAKYCDSLPRLSDERVGQIMMQMWKSNEGLRAIYPDSFDD